MKIHEKYMRRCIQLAKNGLSTASPNPAVGCVIVRDGKITGEGFTSPYGGPHAEVNAIRSVADREGLAGSTLYVSLEPCSHFGKTPPCSDLILKNNIPEVVIGISDPNPLVGGSGIDKLREAGSKVSVGILEEECRNINRRFFIFHEQKRPYIILKWAESGDGYLAPEASVRKMEAEPYWITNKYSRQLVHHWRTAEQAILVGTTTAIEDNPKLNARDWHGKSPCRVIIDKDLKIPQSSNVFDKSARTLVLTEIEAADKRLKGIEYLIMDFSKNIAVEICRILWEQKFLSVIVEGGGRTLQSFIDSGLWDEARIFEGRQHFRGGLPAPNIDGRIIKEIPIDTDNLKIIQRD